MTTRPQNVTKMNPLLAAAERGGYAVGAFSPRYAAMIAPVLKAGQALHSPLIIQMSQKEFARHEITPKELADEFYAQVAQQKITVPLALHLDHTHEIDFIREAIAAGFTSVMIDASDKPFEENIALTREVVAYARSFDVSVESELGRIGTTDFVETDSDEELYTVPEEAAEFVRQTGIDALAASVGTAHGVYMVRQPKVDTARLSAIRALADVHLVLHGGSGVPPEMIAAAISLPGGGVSKVNIATDLEIAGLAAIGREGHLTNPQMNALSPDELRRVQAAVEGVARDKISHFLLSAGQATEVGVE